MQHSFYPLRFFLKVKRQNLCINISVTLQVKEIFYIINNTVTQPSEYYRQFPFVVIDLFIPQDTSKIIKVVQIGTLLSCFEVGSIICYSNL